MKCNKCGAEWTIPASFTSKIEICPFCGNPMQPKKVVFSSLDDVLQYILQNFGLEAMGDGIKLQSIFSDLAPQLKREKVMLRYFVECNGNEVFLNAVHKDQTDAQVMLKTVIDQMENDLLVSHDAVQHVCRSFWSVIGGKEYAFLQPTKTVSTATIPTPVNTSQPVPAAVQDDQLLRLINRNIRPSTNDCKQLYDRGKVLLNFPDQMDTAINMLHYSAKYGDHPSCILLGDCYAKGIGVKKEISTAEDYYRCAATAGNSEAQYKLGVLYHKRKDSYPAKEWLTKSADAGYRPAIDYLRTHLIY